MQSYKTEGFPYLGYFSFSDMTSTIWFIDWLAFRSGDPMIIWNQLMIIMRTISITQKHTTKTAMVKTSFKVFLPLYYTPCRDYVKTALPKILLLLAMWHSNTMSACQAESDIKDTISISLVMENFDNVSLKMKQKNMPGSCKNLKT